MTVYLDVFFDSELNENRFSVKGVPYEDKERFKAAMGLHTALWRPTFKFWSVPLAIWHYNDLRKLYSNELLLGPYAGNWLDAIEKRVGYMLHVKQSEDIPQWKEKWHWAYWWQRVDAYFHLQAGRSFDWSDPGTGKTLKYIIASIESGALDNNGHAIVISPNSAKYNWRNEIRYAEDQIGVRHPITVYAKVISEGKKMSLVEQWVEFGGWFVVHWEAIRTLVEIDEEKTKYTGPGLLLERLGKLPITFLNVDESHRGKSWATQQTKAVDILASKSQRLLEGTGTPVIVDQSDLYAPLHRAYPSMFNNFWWFTNRYGNTYHEEIYVKGGGGQKKTVTKIGIGINEANKAEWDAITSTFSVKRKFEDVVKDVPEKQYKVLPIELNPEQQRMYDLAANRWFKTLEGEYVPLPNAMSQITYLRQICLDPAIVEAPTRQLPAKTDALLDILHDMNGEPLVIMSKFVKYLVRLQEVLHEEKIPFGVITGMETPEKRQEYVDAFQRGELPAILCGIDAAGVAITLTRSHRMAFTDRDWTKALNDQAEGRIRRIGQKYPQLYTILTAEGTVEDRIQQSVEKKTAFEDAFINNSGRISKKELQELLFGR